MNSAGSETSRKDALGIIVSMCHMTHMDFAKLIRLAELKGKSR